MIAITLARIAKGKDTDVILAKGNVIQRIVQVRASKEVGREYGAPPRALCEFNLTMACVIVPV